MTIFRKIYDILIRFSKSYSRQNLYEWLEKALIQFTKPDDFVLSIGAGGGIKNVLKQNHVQFKEIDIDPKRNPDFVCDICDMAPIADGSVDVVVCMEVLEHVTNPVKAISEMRRVLKDGGVVIGSTPFTFPIHDAPNDFFRYTKFGLDHIFRNFTKIALRERNNYINAIYVLILRLFNSGSLSQKIIMVLFSPFVIISSIWVYIFGLFFKNTNITTGYFFIYRK